MAQMMIDCADPNDFAAVVASAENAAGSCTITYAKQHLEMEKVGTSKSIRESSRILSEDTGGSEEAARHKIRRGLEKMGHDSPPKQTQENSDTSEKNTVTKMTNTITEPICQICKIRVVAFHNRTKKRASHGMCIKCRKEHNLIKNKLGQPNIVEIDLQHQQIWKEVNTKMESLLEYIFRLGRAPACIEQSLKGGIDDNLRRLNSVVNSMLWGKNGN